MVDEPKKNDQPEDEKKENGEGSTQEESTEKESGSEGEEPVNTSPGSGKPPKLVKRMTAAQRRIEARKNRKGRE